MVYTAANGLISAPAVCSADLPPHTLSRGIDGDSCGCSRCPLSALFELQQVTPMNRAAHALFIAIFCVFLAALYVEHDVFRCATDVVLARAYHRCVRSIYRSLIVSDRTLSGALVRLYKHTIALLILASSFIAGL